VIKPKERCHEHDVGMRVTHAKQQKAVFSRVYIGQMNIEVTSYTGVVRIP
jgi:hypothetical protein